MPTLTDPRILVDASTRDDAAVYRLAPDRALVATVDFFAPVVDDPYAFGAIAAANAFSDLYAMGATPLVALNILAWPRKPEMLELLSEVLRGGATCSRTPGSTSPATSPRALSSPGASLSVSSVDAMSTIRLTAFSHGAG